MDHCFLPVVCQLPDAAALIRRGCIYFDSFPAFQISDNDTGNTIGFQSHVAVIDGSPSQVGVRNRTLPENRRRPLACQDTIDRPTHNLRRTLTEAEFDPRQIRQRTKSAFFVIAVTSARTAPPSLTEQRAHGEKSGGRPDNVQGSPMRIALVVTVVTTLALAAWWNYPTLAGSKQTLAVSIDPLST
jgi:hypothetical protein